MARLTRRSVIRGSIGLVAAGTLARPYIANAQAKTAEVWWAQGFVPEEDTAIKKIAADYQNASGNTIYLQITPFAPQRQKIVLAMLRGIVLVVMVNDPAEVIALQSWERWLVYVSDGVQ